MLPFLQKHILFIYPTDGLQAWAKWLEWWDVCTTSAGSGTLNYSNSEAIKESLNPRGGCGGLEAQHLCMMMRGVQKQNSVTNHICFFRRVSETGNPEVNLWTDFCQTELIDCSVADFVYFAHSLTGFTDSFTISRTKISSDETFILYFPDRDL